MGDWSDDDTPAAKPAKTNKSTDDDWGDSDKKSSGGGFGSSGRSGDRPQSRKFDDDDDAEKTSEKMLIEGRLCGKIVGPGGSVIQELQSEYHVKINIDREPDEDGKKNVEVVGSASGVKSCVEAINQKIGGGRAPRREQNDDDVSERMLIEGRLCGRIVGPGGSVIQELQSEYNVKINIDREPDDDGKKNVEVVGSESDVKNCVEAINQKIGGGRAPRREPSGDDDGDQSSETIMMPAGLIGRLVGKAGATIQEYSSEYNVKINIDRDGEEIDGKKKVEVVGDKSDVSKAVRAIKEKIMSGGDGDEKPREIYVPPEPSTDESEMFGGGISAGINFDNFDKIQVDVTGEGAAEIKKIALLKFSDSNLRDILKKNIEKSGYQKPTPIQRYAIPIVQSKRDLMGCAQTGSGKTAAFILPILDRIMNEEDSMIPGQPQALIVAPTRELVIQIFDEARKFANTTWVKVCIAYGGTASQHQSGNISRGCHILVATPGRLMDYVGKGLVSFESLKFLVLDEADRMLDMGFNEKIKEITTHPTLNKEKLQTLMFSATFPEEIQRLAGTYLRDYLFLTVGIVGGASVDVEQQFVEVGKFKKRGKLTEILDEYCNNSDEDRILVFVETKKTADFLASLLSETKISSTSIHGDRQQREREEALRDFRKGTRKVLIATSVAARGLDIKGVTHVINYDLPKDVQDYVHRIGRTGRVGNRGKATSFYDPENDSAISSELARILKEAEQPIPAFLGEAGSSYGNDGFGGLDIRKGVNETKKQEEDEDW